MPWEESPLKNCRDETTSDETTSEGRAVLSVYLNLLDFIADPSNEPNKARASDRHVWSAKNDWSVVVVKHMIQLHQWAQIKMELTQMK